VPTIPTHLPAELTPKQNELSKLLSHFSDRYWMAQWLSDIEYLVWEVLASPEPITTMGGRPIDPEDIEKARELAKEINGWISYPEDWYVEGFVPMSEWLVKYRDWKEQYDRRQAEALARMAEKGQTMFVKGD
jgi:hypothetical protein